MKKLILLAGAAGLFLVSASTVPQGGKVGELSSVVAAEPPAPAAKAPPAPAPRAAPSARPASAQRTAEVRNSYPRCSATLRDRCIQGRGNRQQRGYAAAPQRRIQLASRAGERG